MARVEWDQTGEREFETGVDRGVLYLPDDRGVYDSGVGWNGLTTVTEAPSGAESTKTYADNIVYLNLISIEEFGGTIEAYTYPEAFGICDGTQSPEDGVAVGQQTRKPFGLCYRTLIGNDTDSTDHGYKLHLVWNALAAPSEKAYATINDQPEAMALSWEFTTTPIPLTTQVGGRTLKPTAQLVIDSTKTDPDALAALEEILYGDESTDPALPTPDDVIALFSSASRGPADTPRAPTFAGRPDNRITIPVVRGIDYRIGGVVRTGVVAILATTRVVATLQSGFDWPAGTFDTDWVFVFEA